MIKQYKKGYIRGKDEKKGKKKETNKNEKDSYNYNCFFIPSSHFLSSYIIIKALSISEKKC